MFIENNSSITASRSIRNTSSSSPRANRALAQVPVMKPNRHGPPVEGGRVALPTLHSIESN
jgi:hypothetical protein